MTKTCWWKFIDSHSLEGTLRRNLRETIWVVCWWANESYEPLPSNQDSRLAVYKQQAAQRLPILCLTMELMASGVGNMFIWSCFSIFFDRIFLDKTSGFGSYFDHSNSCFFFSKWNMIPNQQAQISAGQNTSQLKMLWFWVSQIQSCSWIDLGVDNRYNLSCFGFCGCHIAWMFDTPWLPPRPGRRTWWPRKRRRCWRCHPWFDRLRREPAKVDMSMTCICMYTHVYIYIYT